MGKFFEKLSGIRLIGEMEEMVVWTETMVNFQFKSLQFFILFIYFLFK